MKAKQFFDEYDKELTNLLIIIQKHLDDFSNRDKAIINSWVKFLSLHSDNVSYKINRNLYCILLLDNILNKELKKPFDKYITEFIDFPLLNPLNVKINLTNKFLEEIKKEKLNISNIQLFINKNYNFNTPLITTSQLTKNRNTSHKFFHEPTSIKLCKNVNPVRLTTPNIDIKAKTYYKQSLIENNNKKESCVNELINNFKMQKYKKFLLNKIKEDENIIEKQGKELKEIKDKINELELIAKKNGLKLKQKSVNKKNKKNVKFY